MMNIVKLQDQLKNFSQEQLISAMQMPDGSTPQYLVLGEIMRRKQMESSAAAQPAPESTVAEDAVAAAGVPQGGIADMARALAPKTDMAQNTGIQAMASGGPVKKMAVGDLIVNRGGRFIEQANGTYLPEAEALAQPDPMLQAAEESANEAAALREEAGITESFRTPEEALANAAEVRAATDSIPAVPDVPAAPQGGGGGGGGGMSPFEQQLMDALASREKAAKQDKWLSLAQVGLNLMSSKEPTLLGALGESGLKGVEAARTARDQYDKDKLDLQGALEQSRMARAAASARAAAGASRKAIPEGALDMYDAEIEALSAAASDPMAQPGEQLAAANRLDAILAEKAQFRDAYRAQFGIEPTGASPAATSGVYSMDDVSQ
jgi:hypothetical protein